MADFYNTKHETLITGTSSADSILNHGGKVTISTGNGDDSIDNIEDDDYTDEDNEIHSAFDVSINTGAGNDSVWNDGDKVTINTGAGNDCVYNIWGWYCTINTGAGNDSVWGDSYCTINTGEGNDYVWGDSYCTINTGEGNDEVNNWHGSSSVTINTGAGNDSVYNAGGKVIINTGTGNDYIYNSDAYLVTINAGLGKDLISLDSVGYKNVIVYESGDGNDKIYGFKADSTLSISGGSYSTEKIGDDVIVTVGDGKISLVGAASLSAVNIYGEKTQIETNSWKISGTTATYGDLITVKGVKSTEGLSVSGNVVTVSKSSLNAKKITVSDGYTLALAEDVPKPTTKKTAWTISGTTATYKSSYKTAGYKLASNGKSISYSKATSATTLATVKGVKSTKGLSVSGKVITVSKASLGTSKVTISGTGYTLKLGSDVTAPTTKKAAWSLSGTTATYKSSYKTAGYKLASNGKSIAYSKATAAKNLATVKGAKSKSGLSVSGKKITLKNAALSKKVTVSGSGYEFDFAKDYSSATITGSGNDDTITTRGNKISVNGGKGADTIKILGTGTVKGGAGADIFYYKSNGANIISDYAEEDKISIDSGAADVTTSGDNVVLTVGNGKITAKGAKSKVIAYSDASGDHTYPKDNDVVIDGKKITLTEDYLSKNFNVADYGEALQTIDASAVQQDININGNTRKNKIIGSTENDSIYGDDAADTIYGGEGVDTLNGGKGNDILYGEGGNDSLWGNKGDDTLYGGDGADIFVYKKGDGNDVIADFESIDKIMIFNAKVGSYNADTTTGKVTFKVGDGQIVIKNGVDKFITLVDSAENELAKYPSK